MLKKIFLASIAVLVFISPAWAEKDVDKIYLLTFELYTAVTPYSQVEGGETTAPSGTSAMTWTAMGHKAASLDNKTIDLNSYLGADTRVYCIQLGTPYLESNSEGTIGGVTLGRSEPYGETGGASGNTATVRLYFSNIDPGTTDYWAGVSYFGHTFDMSSGSPFITFLDRDDSPGALGRYMRVVWESGISAFRRAAVTIGLAK